MKKNKIETERIEERTKDGDKKKLYFAIIEYTSQIRVTESVFITLTKKFTKFSFGLVSVQRIVRSVTIRPHNGFFFDSVQILHSSQ